MMRFVLCLAAALSLSHAAYAGPLEDLTKAEQKTYDAWQSLPLTERTITFIAEPSTGYGLYKEKGSNVFKPGEKIITYVEPIGYGWKDIAGDLYELNFVTDLTLTAENGDVVTDQKGFSKTVFQSHNQNMEFSMDFTLTLDGVPAGKYTLEYTIHDMSGKQVSTFDQEVEIAKGA
jgi:hypothetical protein